MATRNELEDLLRAAPLDDAAYLIFADWLQAHGDPRGELIALDDAARHAPPEERLAWRERRAAVLARAPELVPPVPPGVSYTWHLGFVRRVRVEVSPEELPEGCFAHPSLAFVTSIEVDHWQVPTPAAIAYLAAHAPPTVRTLALGNPRRTWQDPDAELDLAPVLAAWPLEQLVSSHGVRLGRAPALRSVELVGPGVGAVEELARLPALEHAGLSFTGRSRAMPTIPVFDAGVLAPLLANPPPRLTSLHLQLTGRGDHVLEVLARSALLRQLRVLRVWNAGLTLESARHVTHDAFGHLAVLDLSDAGLAPATVARLEQAVPGVRTIPDRLR